MAETKRACIVGGGMCKFGVRAATIFDMLQEATSALSKDIPGLKPQEIDGLIFASTTAGRNSNSLNTAPIVAHRLGLKPTSICVRVDTLCSGSNTAIILAKGLIESGIAEVIMVCGTEKLNMPQRWESVYMNLMTNDHDWDSAMGLAVPPPFFGMIADAHMKKYGTTKAQMGAVSVTNYDYGFTNPLGQFGGRKLTIEEYLDARTVCDPFGLNDCCPVTDGASAVIIASEERAKAMTDRKLVYLRGTGQTATHGMSAGWPGETLADWPHLKKAGEVAYKNAQLTPQDIDVAQTHDCFSISEIIEVEELGFCKKGEGGEFVASGQVRVDGKTPVNTDGGLLTVGHPYGATGARQALEICKQLQGRAINQVKDPKFALTHNLSGVCAQHTVVIYGTEPVK
ncbi:MAG: thiolase family protein [Dehalococcoidales bacterium]|nr:thiolase family protein [Dehalococcoidales bacterium]